LVCLSANSITKTGYFQKEIKEVLDVADLQPEDTIFVIPVRIEDCAVPSRLAKWQWVDLFERNGYEQFVTALRVRASTLRHR
jgi:TIR domain